MFDQIPFLRQEGSFSSEDVRRNADYVTFMQQNKLPRIADEEYQLDGEASSLLPRPMSPERQANLIYLQSFTYMKAKDSYYTSRQSYHSFLLLYTYQGEGILEYEDRQYQLKKDDLFLIDCRKAHIYKTHMPEWRHADLHFWGGISEFLVQEFFCAHGPVYHCSQGRQFQSLLERLLLIYCSADPMRDFKFSVDLESLLRFILEDEEKQHPRNQIPNNIQALQNYLEQHFAEPISLDEMAVMSGFSKYHLVRQFKKYTGLTPKQYILHLRLLQAEALLHTTTLPAYKIGVLVGFDSEASFIAHFRKTYGMTPGEFRSR